MPLGPPASSQHQWTVPLALLLFLAQEGDEMTTWPNIHPKRAHLLSANCNLSQEVPLN